MYKNALIKKISESVQMSQKDVRVVINEFLKNIVKTTANGENIVISGFGKFKSIHKSGIIPRSKERYETKVITFSTANRLKKLLNEK